MSQENARHNDPRSSDDIIAAALVAEDDDSYWDLVTTLQFRATHQVFEAARTLTDSEDPAQRCLGVDILAQLGVPVRAFREEVLDILVRLLRNDCDADVLGSAATACGHNTDARTIGPLVRLKNHPSADVRRGVAYGLLTLEKDSAVRALIELSEDPDDDVRDWATFGLGQMIDLDTPEIREALARRLDDKHAEIRGEALVGLAGRRDIRVIEPLIGELRTISEAGDSYWDHAFEAAESMPDPRLYPVLMAASESCGKDQRLEHAIALCRIPTPDEQPDEPDDEPTTCPVCWLRNAFDDQDRWEFCARCGWARDKDQTANPDLADGWNPRTLDQERKRWCQRSRGCSAG